jgi:hypothetical protein
VFNLVVRIPSSNDDVGSGRDSNVGARVRATASFDAAGSEGWRRVGQWLPVLIRRVTASMRRWRRTDPAVTARETRTLFGRPGPARTHPWNHPVHLGVACEAGVAMRLREPQPSFDDAARTGPTPTRLSGGPGRRSMYGLPAVACFAAYIVISIFGRPRAQPPGQVDHSTRLGGLICFGGMFLAWVLFLAATALI